MVLDKNLNKNFFLQEVLKNVVMVCISEQHLNRKYFKKGMKKSRFKLLKSPFVSFILLIVILNKIMFEYDQQFFASLEIFRTFW